MPVRLAAIFVALVLLGASGCGRIEGSIAAPQSPSPSGRLLAGAGEVDITPPPGFPMGGHSIEGQIGRGFWTRLRARSVYIEDASGQPLVLTIADLWGMPSGLVDRVTEIVQTEYELAHLSRASIVLAATHTHHGPANFASSRVFSRFVGPVAGFDPALFEFLAQRIAWSIAAAARAKRPATLHRADIDVPDVARNRSLPPFLENPEHGAVLERGRSVDCILPPLGLPDPPPADPCRAVDPVLRVLRIDDAEEPSATIALVGVFAVHPTAMPNSTLVYGGDLFSVASEVAARSWVGPQRPVVALFNGAEGDVSPNWSVQGRDETVALGSRLGRAFAEAKHGATALEIDRIRMAYDRPMIAGTPTVDPNGNPVTVADRGLPGTATVGGAEDGRTRWHARGFVEGRVAKRERLRGHGPKRPAVPAGLLLASIPRDHVPRNAPLGVYRLGSLVFATLPGEFTTTMGLRVRRSVAASAGVPVDSVIALGLAHGHLEYFATPQEYALQHYEGSSTFYGPHSGSLVAQHAADIAVAGTVRHPSEYFYRPGRVRRFKPRARPLRRPEDDLLAAALSLPSLDAAPSTSFIDDAPTWPPVEPLDPVTPRASLEVWRNGHWISVGFTDDGPKFASIAIAKLGNRWQWRTWWLAKLPEGEPVRIRAVGVDRASRCSPPLAAGVASRASAKLCDLPPG